MNVVDNLRKTASSVREHGITSEKAELLVKKAHEVKIATLLTFLNKIK